MKQAVGRKMTRREMQNLTRRRGGQKEDTKLRLEDR
jgi:hypothetical protein